MEEENKRVVRRFIDEVFNRGDIKLLPELISPDHVSHLPMGDHYGPEGVRIDIDGFRTAFPDLVLHVEVMVAENDHVVYRFIARGTHNGPFMGIAPTGRHVEVEGIAIDCVRNGKTVERWVQYDSLSLLQQLGAGASPAIAAD